MGALTDNRKRCFLDLCGPFSTSAVAVQPHSELFSGGSVKRPKVSTPPRSSPEKGRLPPTPPVPPRREGSVQADPRILPPPAPLRRPVHGPQRIVRVFGHGAVCAPVWRPSPEQIGKKEGVSGMGNLISRSINRESLSTLWSSRSKENAPVEPGKEQRFKDDNIEGLDLEDYKRLVEDVQDSRSVPSEIARGKNVLPWPVSSTVSDLTTLRREEDELQRKAEDAGRVVHVESKFSKENLVEAPRAPFYKDLLHSAKKRDLRLNSLDFEVKLMEKKISEFHKAVEGDSEKDLHGPFVPLTVDEENEVELALQEPHNFHLRRNEILVVHERSNIEITREVIQCLRPGAWLNDEVINLYFELLKERERREPKKYLKCHFFNTFFYKKLISGRNSYDYKAVRRWTTQRKLGYGLIECDKIFVPIHREIHWCLAVIDVKNEKFLYLDSLGGMDLDTLEVLARYFLDEVEDKSSRTVDLSSWSLEQVNNLPLQKNGWDCGMFMIKYADFYSRNLSLCFQQNHMMYFRRRTAKEILDLRAE